MKNTKIMAVLAFLLAAALFVGAASAAPTPMAQNSTIFVNQQIGYGMFGESAEFTLYKMSGDASPIVLDQFNVTADMRLLPELIGKNTGVWYNNTDITSTATSTRYLSIWYPEVTVKAELSPAAGNSIDGKTINKNTPIDFIIDAPKLGGVKVDAGTANATVKVVFTTPAGGKTTYFGSNTFSSIPLDDRHVVKSGVIPTNEVAGTWTAQAEFVKPNSFSNYAAKSNTISFTVQSNTVTITAAKDSVVRSNPFTVSIQGKSLVNYAVYIETPSTTDINPTLQADQSGFQKSASWTGDNYEIQSGNITYNSDSQVIGGVFKTDASGKRTIQFNTNANTEDKTYTIKVSAFNNDKVSDGWDYSTYDKVKVKVEKGAVTISASGDGRYYIGQEIKLSGTNTDSSDIFLFITGPNLATDGINLKMVDKKKDEASHAYMSNNPVSVYTDNTWEYKWDTSSCGLDTGAYTIYATSRITNGKSSSEKKISKKDGSDYYAVKLSDSEYATVSVNLKQPFLSAVPSGTIVAKGDKIHIRGTAEGNPGTLQLYIFGPNKFVYESITVEDDGTYEKKLNIGSEWASNQYYVVIEHPMYNGKIDVNYNKNEGSLYINNTEATSTVQSSFNVEKLQGSNAADALTKMIDSPNIDDIYTKLTFTVAEPWIKVKNPGDQAVGSKFTITGTTNLAVDDQLLIEVVSSSFNPVDKTATSVTSGVSVTTKVVAGEGSENTWSVEVDTTNWKLDEYTIKAGGIEVDVTTTTNFNLVEKVATPTPTATGATPTATATATATATPATPGFSAFIALAGLGSVALLVLRRN